MGESEANSSEPQAARALEMLEEALAILDDTDMPSDIGAHVDLAICRLRDRLQQSGDPEGPVASPY